jgi:anti-anti-sigma factor
MARAPSHRFSRGERKAANGPPPAWLKRISQQEIAMIYQEAKPGAMIQLTLTPGYAVLALGGTITVEYSETIREQLRAVVLGGQRCVLVDFASVTEIDSSGLAALISLVKLARERGGAVRCCGASPSVYAVFELTRLHRILDFFPNQAVALSQPWGRSGADDA